MERVNAFTAYDGVRRYWGGTFIYPSNLAWLLQHVYEDSRRAGIAGVRSISGGLLGHSGGLRGERGLGGLAWAPEVAADGAANEAIADSADLAADPSGAAYLQATYRCGRSLAGWDEVRARYGSYPLDGIGQHLYIDQARATGGAHLADYLQAVRDACLAWEGPGTAKQTYVTEFGWQTRALSPDLQAANLETAYGAFRETSYVAQAY